jgi:hypothetical protein
MCHTDVLPHSIHILNMPDYRPAATILLLLNVLPQQHSYLYVLLNLLVKHILRSCAYLLVNYLTALDK